MSRRKRRLGSAAWSGMLPFGSMVSRRQLAFPLALPVGVALAAGTLFVAPDALAQAAPIAPALTPAPSAAAPAATTTPAPASAGASAPAVDKGQAVMAGRFERSGDDWAAAGAYREAANAYERAYELEPTDSLSHKLVDARARAGIALPSPAPARGTATPVVEPLADVPAERFRTHWYGYQPLLIDGGTFLLLLVSAAAQSGTGAALTLIPYVVGGPTVHLVHGRYGTAGIDLAVRAGAPLVSGVLGFAIGAGLGAASGGSANNNGLDSPALVGAVIGGALGFCGGIAAAIAIDAGVLSKERVTPATPSAFQWAPTMLPLKGGANVGVAGTF